MIRDMEQVHLTKAVLFPPGTRFPKPVSPIKIGIGVAVGAVVCGLLPEVCGVVAPVVALP